MKAIILAAGRGTRMGTYTSELPKGMLNFNNKTLIQWQLEKLEKAPLSKIIIVTGYQNELIQYPDVTYYHNAAFSKTNMIESLMCAREEFTEDILICYSDIIYSSEVLGKMISSHGDINVAVDVSWKAYWNLRFGTTELDLESLTVSEDGTIVELGKPVDSSEGLKYRYMGLIKFSHTALNRLQELYENKKSTRQRWKPSGNSFEQGYMTDLLNELIGVGETVNPVVCEGGWLEFDTASDYEITTRNIGKGIFDNIF